METHGALTLFLNFIFPPNMKLRFGGNAQRVWQSLDEKFLQEGVASLAMLSYEVPIRDGNFFQMKTFLPCISKTL